MTAPSGPETAPGVGGPVEVAGARRGLLAEPMFATALHLMTNTVVTNGLGVLFWLVAARLYEPSTVGRDSALVSLMITLSTIGQLDMAHFVVRFLPAARGSRSRLVAAAYGVAVVASLIVAGAVLLVVPHLSRSLRFLTDERAVAVGLLVSVTLWSIFSIQDSVLTALGRASWVPVENAAFGVLKLVVLAVFARIGYEHGTFLAFVLPMALLLLPVNLLIFRRVVPQAPPPSEEAVRGAQFGRRRLLTYAGQDYLGSMMVHTGLTVLPLLVIALLGSRENAFFYLPLLMVLAFDTLFSNACTSLVVAGSAEVSRQKELARLMVRRAVLLLVPGALAIVLLAPYVLLLFGQEYADNATTMMRLLALASIPRAAHSLFTALARFRGDGSAILTRQFLSVTALVVGTVVLAPRYGLTGVGLAWLGASVVVLLTVARPLVTALRTP